MQDLLLLDIENVEKDHVVEIIVFTWRELESTCCFCVCLAIIAFARNIVDEHNFIKIVVGDV